jgi:hypothetical protein
MFQEFVSNAVKALVREDPVLSRTHRVMAPEGPPPVHRFGIWQASVSRPNVTW